MKEFKYTIDGKEYKVEIGEINEDTYTAKVKVNGENFEVGMEKPTEQEKKKVVLGKPSQAASDEEQAAPTAGVNTQNAVKAPLPGTITGINVEVGQEVKAGDTLVVLEAMKMANNIEAEKEEEYTETFANPYQAAQFGYIDDVIEPRNTRFRICRGLAQLAHKRMTLPAKKHGCMPM